jgi:hypothetical protein
VALEDELDRLYELPLDEFVRERNALSSRLRKDGDRDAAEQVKALQKPSVVAWAVNRLARTDEVPLRALLNAADELRAAQRKALGGSGADVLRPAIRAERDAVSRLTRAAERELERAGHRPSPATLDRIASTLRAAAADVQARELLRRGRLTQEIEAGGFDALAGMPLGGEPQPKGKGKGKGKGKDKQAQAEDDRAARRRAVAAAREQVRVLQRRSRELLREADRAEREAAEAGRKAERARTDADRAAAALAEAEEALRAAQSSG